ncbi:MAG: F0F1 ATP synthase subunit epsilon [Gammaproteobacteria bacterium]|jgi:F-type H+-transporting ATPase subunit epsilon|nr:F0F1 ATP synthase subunit epsilon [Gammaproteobacteria bacterium]
MSTIHVEIVSAEREIFSGDVEIVFAPARLGEVGILPGHAAMLTPLRPGEVRVQMVGGEQQAFYVSGGMLEVQPKVVTVLSDTAIRAHDLDEAAVMKAKQEAEEALANRSDKVDFTKAQAELAELAAQLQTIQRLRRRGG